MRTSVVIAATAHHATQASTASPATVRPTLSTRLVRRRSRSARSTSATNTARPTASTANGMAAARPYVTASVADSAVRTSSTAGRILVCMSFDALAR